MRAIPSRPILVGVLAQGTVPCVLYNYEHPNCSLRKSVSFRKSLGCDLDEVECFDARAIGEAA